MLRFATFVLEICAILGLGFGWPVEALGQSSNSQDRGAANQRILPQPSQQNLDASEQAQALIQLQQILSASRPRSSSNEMPKLSELQMRQMEAAFDVFRQQLGESSLPSLDNIPKDWIEQALADPRMQSQARKIIEQYAKQREQEKQQSTQPPATTSNPPPADSTRQRSTKLPSTTQPAAMQPSTTQRTTAQPSATQPSATQGGAVQQQTVQPPALRLPTTRSATTPTGTEQSRASESDANSSPTQPSLQQGSTTQSGGTPPFAPIQSTAQPSTAQPSRNQPIAIQPNALQPRSTEPSPTNPRTYQDGTQQPSSTQPPNLQPKALSPSLTQNVMTEQSESKPTSLQRETGLPQSSQTEAIRVNRWLLELLDAETSKKLAGEATNNYEPSDPASQGKTDREILPRESTAGNSALDQLYGSNDGLRPATNTSQLGASVDEADASKAETGKEGASQNYPGPIDARTRSTLRQLFEKVSEVVRPDPGDFPSDLRQNPLAQGSQPTPRSDSSSAASADRLDQSRLNAERQRLLRQLASRSQAAKQQRQTQPNRPSPPPSKVGDQTGGSRASDIASEQSTDNSGASGTVDWEEIFKLNQPTDGDGLPEMNWNVDPFESPATNDASKLAESQTGSGASEGRFPNDAQTRSGIFQQNRLSDPKASSPSPPTESSRKSIRNEPAGSMDISEQVERFGLGKTLQRIVDKTLQEQGFENQAELNKTLREFSPFNQPAASRQSTQRGATEASAGQSKRDDSVRQDWSEWLNPQSSLADGTSERSASGSAAKSMSADAQPSRSGKPNQPTEFSKFASKVWKAVRTAPGDQNGGAARSAAPKAASQSATTPNADGDWTATIWWLALAAALIVGGVVYWRAKQQPSPANALSLEARWAREVLQAGLATREDVVRAFHGFVLERPNVIANWWTHRRIARRLSESSPRFQPAVDELTNLYELARYLPPDEELSIEQVHRAQQALRECSRTGLTTAMT